VPDRWDRCHDGFVSVRDDCRHYASRSLPTGETVQRCRLDVATETPFACPEDCLFFEERAMGAGWQVADPGD
jgi:hypothetical protein